MHGLGNPLALLRCHIRGRKDSLCRIDQEEDEDLAMTRFGGVPQAEWLDLVLVQVWECDTSVGFRDHIADILYARGGPNIYGPQFTRYGDVHDW